MVKAKSEGRSPRRWAWRRQWGGLGGGEGGGAEWVKGRLGSSGREQGKRREQRVLRPAAVAVGGRGRGGSGLPARRAGRQGSGCRPRRRATTRPAGPGAPPALSPAGSRPQLAPGRRCRHHHPRWQRHRAPRRRMSGAAAGGSGGGGRGGGSDSDRGSQDRGRAGVKGQYGVGFQVSDSRAIRAARCISGLQHSSRTRRRSTGADTARAKLRRCSPGADTERLADVLTS
jgi:hypothetical protein